MVDRNGSRIWLPMLVLAGAVAAAWLVHERWKRPIIVVPALGMDWSPEQANLPRVLVFTRTLGYRHQSIPAGVRTIQEIGHGLWITEHTEDPTMFRADRLGGFRAVIFLSTTGNVLDALGQRDFEAWVRNGGGYVGVHAASDTEHEWPWYGELVGAWFRNHTDVIAAVVTVERPDGPGMRGLPQPWRRTDEWYAFQTNPRPHTQVLASLDDAQMGEAGMGGDHPIAWCHAMDRGRAWYTGMGHTVESFAEPLFRGHLREGIRWAMGETP
ncbi:MAG: hypothetical protein RLZZ558_698 [Planctomycetota bacterium]|jgi:type 1 glutamine amidotransferase